jgi:hypothetical protein
VRTIQQKPTHIQQTSRRPPDLPHPSDPRGARGHRGRPPRPSCSLAAFAYTTVDRPITARSRVLAAGRVDSLVMLLKAKTWLVKLMPFLARWGSNTTPNP